MKYTKPEVAVCTSAIWAIHASDSNKSIQTVVDNLITGTKGTSTAYESDE